MVALIEKLGAARIAAMGVVAFLMLGFFAFIIFRVSAPQYSPLYGDLTIEDSSAILSELDSMGVQYQLRGDGTSILVPRDDVLKIRMDLAQEGLPNGGSLGYELFDKSDSLGTTSFVQNLNHVRALEGELARSIRTIRQVQAARVHLVLPERELFRRDRQEPTASIVMKVRGELDKGTIRAIQHLAASAVEGLKPSRVSIVDEAGRLLASGAEDGDLSMLNASLDERSSSMEARFRREIEGIVEGVVGVGRVKARVAVDLEHNRISQTSNIFDPEGQVVRSSQSREEEQSMSQPSPNGNVTVGDQLPGEAGDAGVTAAREDGTVTEETVNYEVSNTTRTEVIEAGQTKRISVAVLVDGTYSEDANGQKIYAPRSPEQIEQIAALVRSAIGYDGDRGDNVEVINMQFAEGPFEPLGASDEGFTLSKQDYFAMAELGTIFLLTMIVLFFVVRPLLKRIVAGDEVDLAAVPVGGEGAPGTIVDENGNVILSPQPGVPDAALENTTVQAIEQAQTLGQLQAESLQKVGELIEKNTEESVAVVRGWLNEPTNKRAA